MIVDAAKAAVGAGAAARIPFLNARLGGVAILGLARLLAALLGFAAITVLARKVEPATLGVWAMLLAVQGYALHLSEFGLRSVATAECAAAHDPRCVLRTYLMRRLCAGALILVLGTVLAAILIPQHATAMAIALAAILATALQLDWLALVADRPRSAGALLLVRPAVWLALVLVMPFESETLTLAAAFLLAWSVAALASWPQLRHVPDASPAGPEVPAGRMLRLGFPALLVTVTNQARSSADLLAVGAAFGAVAAAPFYLAGAVAVAGCVFANAAGQSALASIGRCRDDRARVRVALRRGVREAVAIGALVATAGALAAVLILEPLFGPGYGEARPILLAMMPWLLLVHPTTFLESVLTATRRQHLAVRGNLVMLAALTVVLILGVLLGNVILCALARAVAEAARLAFFLFLVRGDAREQRVAGICN